MSVRLLGFLNKTSGLHKYPQRAYELDARLYGYAYFLFQQEVKAVDRHYAQIYALCMHANLQAPAVHTGASRAVRQQHGPGITTDWSFREPSAGKNATHVHDKVMYTQNKILSLISCCGIL